MSRSELEECFGAMGYIGNSHEQYTEEKDLLVSQFDGISNSLTRRIAIPSNGCDKSSLAIAYSAGAMDAAAATLKTSTLNLFGTLISLGGLLPLLWHNSTFTYQFQALNC